MFEGLKKKINAALNMNNKTEEKKIELSVSLDKNLEYIKSEFPNSMDLNTKEIRMGRARVLFLSCEGMIDNEKLVVSLANPLLSKAQSENFDSASLVEYLKNESLFAADQKEIYDLQSLFKLIMSGFVVVLIDGIDTGFAFGLQGFKYRSIAQPENEVNELGAKEGFTEPIRVNLSMIRRRIKSPTLRFEVKTVGEKSKTDVCMVYLEDKVSKKILKELHKKIQRINLDIVLDSSYIRPYLEKNPFSLFSSVGNTERPDVLCGKINEGRIAVLVDGSPYALILPYLFSENFKSFDDYAHRPYFSTFVRILKYFSFYISFLLPGGYVAVSTFHPELLPHALLFSVAASEETIPFSLMTEAIFIYLVFEIMREAGIRLPSAIGHTIGIVGALVIGDAAVNAGLIGAPMVMVVAITAICAFSIPQLYEPIMILRFIFIIVGGLSGLFGIALGFVLVSALICSMNSFKVPMASPLSPFDLRWFMDSIVFSGIKSLSKRSLRIQNIEGSEVKDKGE